MPLPRQPLAGAHATDVGFDPVKLGDPAQTLGRDFGTVAIEDLDQLAPRLGPAMGDGDRHTACPGGPCQAVVAGIAIHLQNAVKALQDTLGILARAVGGVGEDHAGWICPAP